MMEVFQYGGALLIITGYWFMLKNPMASAFASFIGCVLCGVWAYFMGAWGILAIEVMCASLSLNNAWTSGRR